MEVNFFHFSDIPASERYFWSSRDVFLNGFFIPYGVDGSSVLWKPVFSYLMFFIFCKLKTFTESSGNNFFRKAFVPVERDCPPSGN